MSGLVSIYRYTNIYMPVPSPSSDRCTVKGMVCNFAHKQGMDRGRSLVRYLSRLAHANAVSTSRLYWSSTFPSAGVHTSCCLCSLASYQITFPQSQISVCVSLVFPSPFLSVCVCAAEECLQLWQSGMGMLCTQWDAVWSPVKPAYVASRLSILGICTV